MISTVIFSFQRSWPHLGYAARHACCWPTSFALSKYVSPSRKKKVRIPVTGGPWRSQRMVASVRSGVPVARSKRHVCATGFLFYFWWSAGRRVIMSTVVAGEGRASKESLSVCSLFGVPCQVTKRGAARRPCQPLFFWQGLPQQHSARQAKTSVLISPPCDGSVGRASSGARVVVGQWWLTKARGNRHGIKGEASAEAARAMSGAWESVRTDRPTPKARRWCFSFAVTSAFRAQKNR
jgi:hypothetical protein